MLQSRHSRVIALAAAVVGAAYSIVWAAGTAAPAPARPPDDAERVAFFDKEVRPLLESHCIKCHGGEDKIKGGLRLASREDLLRGGDLGPVVDLGSRGDSLLLRAIQYRDDKLQMPPKGKLPPEAIATLTKWVELGVPFSATPLVAPKAAPAHEKVKSPADSKTFWSFRPVKRPEVPTVKRSDWVRNPTDAFVLA